MFIRKKPKPLLLALLTCATFTVHATAWWDTWKSAGDDGKANTQGNAAAAASKTKVSRTVSKSYVGLVNNTTSILTSAMLKDKKGKVLYTSTAGRTCAVGAVCWLRVSPDLMAKGNTFFFYNNNKLVSAVVLDNLSVNASLYNIGASMDSLGLYVMNKIRAVNSKVTYSRIDNDIQTTTLTATPYQELADYYLDLMGNSKDNTAQEAKVIKSMADQFAKNQAIPANPATNRLSNKKTVKAKKSLPAKATGRMVAAAAPASASSSDDNPVQNALCSQTLSSAMGLLQNIPMIGDAVSTIAQTAQAASCPGSDQGVKDFMAEQFAVVNSKLADISTQLVGLENQLKEFENTYNMDKFTQQKQDADNNDDQLKSWLEDYQRALLTSRGKDGKEYNSLNELVSSFGSVNKAFAKNPELRGILDDYLYKNTEQYNAIVSLGYTSSFSTDKKDRLCGNPEKIAGNVLEIRAACNAIIIAMYSKNVMLAKQMAYAYNDVYKVYQMDTRLDKQTIKLISPDKIPTWETSVEQMNPTKAITTPVGKNEQVFTLTNNLMAKGFKITGWYTDADKRYLETNYTLDNSTIIKSKYAYQHPTRDGEKISYAAYAEIDSNIANVMGVPVPERFFTADGKSRNNYGAIEAFPWSNSGLYNGVLGTSLLSQCRDGKCYPPEIFSTEKANVVFSAFSFDPAKSYTGAMISPNNGFTEGDRKIFVADGTNRYAVKYAVDDYDKIGGGEFFTFMRFTDSLGFSYVGAIRTWIHKFSPWNPADIATLQCMTNDCLTFYRDNNRLGYLKYNNGPTEVYWDDSDGTSTRTLTVK